ncbi:extracellular solute-binding protein [Microbacterium sp. NPDC087589]|uniref:extracellular solute-binding protein n=1 Tax=Microbacterium sp. NPDC087589 TaxID=3364191 RepID=UPI003825B13E
MNKSRITRSTTAAAIVLVSSVALAACAAGSAPSGGSADDVDAALEAGGELLVWGWEPTLTPIVEAFEEEHPNVDVTLANVGTGNDHYVALQNAILAGSGVPDVAQIEFYALPQFTSGDSLADLTPFGAAELEGEFAPGPWGAVSNGETVIGLPGGGGPMALFYNAAVFERLGVEVPTTWDEYLEAGRQLHAADPNVYVATDGADPGYATSMIWQAGGQPFRVDGTTVSVDLADEGTQKYSALWQQLLDENLLSSIPAWSDEWFSSLGDGTVATMVTGAWMALNLQSSSPAGEGDWRVAPMPTWEEGDSASAENGGGALSVTEASQNKALAYAFTEFANLGEGVQIAIDAGSFPTTTADLESPEFLATEFPYFGGQKLNEIFADSSANVVLGWQYLPYQVYANSIFADTAGQAFIGNTTVEQGLLDWQDSIVSYGTDQGFTID